jgi:hypothetical protein
VSKTNEGIFFYEIDFSVFPFHQGMEKLVVKKEVEEKNGIK